MDIKELRAKSAQELKQLIDQLRTQITQGNFHMSTGQFTKLKGVREARKTLARVQTILVEKTNAS